MENLNIDKSKVETPQEQSLFLWSFKYCSKQYSTTQMSTEQCIVLSLRVQKRDRKNLNKKTSHWGKQETVCQLADNVNFTSTLP